MGYGYVCENTLLFVREPCNPVLNVWVEPPKILPKSRQAEEKGVALLIVVLTGPTGQEPCSSQVQLWYMHHGSDPFPHS